MEAVELVVWFDLFFVEFEYGVDVFYVLEYFSSVSLCESWHIWRCVTM